MYSFLVFLAFDFCRFCVAIRFFIPAKMANDLRLWRISIPDLIHHLLIFILEKEPVFPFSMLSAKRGNYWYHFYNIFGMTRSLTGDCLLLLICSNFCFQFSCSVYNLVTFFSADIAPDSATRCSDLTTSTHQFLTWLDHVQ